MKRYLLKEHEKILGIDLDELKESLPEILYSSDEVKYLGLSPSYEVSYFIGVDWIIENHSYIQVLPKIEEIDYLGMFIDCLKENSIDYDLSKIYHINFTAPPITIDTHKFNLTPLIMIHFLSIMRNLVKKGLKKDYVLFEENLESKIKGKLLFNRHLNVNIVKGRLERNFCKFQEYSINCIENRFLKKTLLFVQRYLINNSQSLKNINQELLPVLNYCKAAFQNVSEDVDLKKINNLKLNPLYKEYHEALNIAKIILRKFDYSINNINHYSDSKVHPFYIDMSLLFEFYVLNKLKAEYKDMILFQAKGKYGAVDFLKLDEQLILDTKYKTLYNENSYDIENIRQLSGYSRDKGILKKLNVENNRMVDCIIIYPNKERPIDFRQRVLKEEEISQFVNFYKIGIKLPVVNNSM